jgi:peptide/nickel transport system substrate-binding protein
MKGIIMSTGVLAIIVSLVLSLTMIDAEAATTQQILPDPLAKLDIKDAVMVSTRGVPTGRLTIGQHYALDPGWLDPIQYGTSLTQQHYSYLVHDALIKPMPQGVHTYSLAEQAEMTADFTKAVFRLRPGLKFHDGHPLTTTDVKWTYEHYKGVNFKLLHDKLEHIEIVDDRTIIFHFKEPFVDFLDLYNGGNTGIGWIAPQHHYERVGPAGFKERPLGAGPFKFVSQEAGVQMIFEAWEEYWRQTPGVKTIMVKGIGDPATRLAGLLSGELDMAYGMTGKVLPRVMREPNLRWDRNYTSPLSVSRRSRSCGPSIRLALTWKNATGWSKRSNAS